ncbi:MAG: hypothetical protein RLZZ401_2190 [Pseudomonadota bacterium]|jgi:hypothetical protein
MSVPARPFSLNALLLTPARVRWCALQELWLYRSYWRLPEARRAMRAERDAELAETVPVLLLLALLVATLLFVLLPSTLGEQATGALALLWPVWVVQVAPLLCALLLALLNAPGIALQLTEREAAGEFAGDPRTRSALAARHCVPLIVAHTVVCVASLVLLVLLVLVLGLLAQAVLALGDVRASAAIVLTRVDPVHWLRALFNAGVLGLACVGVAVVYAWPGTQITQRGLDVHRLGLRAMLLSAAASVAAAIAVNGLATLLGWSLPR